jgi:Lrp/AsnC family transcriptional regulator, leucine-responsive regulatory protein
MGGGSLLRSRAEGYNRPAHPRFLSGGQNCGSAPLSDPIEKSGRSEWSLGLRNRKSPEPRSDAALDAIDRKILRILQRGSLIANQALADEVGLSPPACLKRVRLLRATGAIQRTVAMLSPDVLGYPLLTVARIKLERPREKAMRGFEQRMRELPRVALCLTVAGDIDYIVLVRSRDVAHYQDFARQVLATAPGIRSYTSEIVLEVPKWTTEIPVEDQ